MQNGELIDTEYAAVVGGEECVTREISIKSSCCCNGYPVVMWQSLWKWWYCCYNCKHDGFSLSWLPDTKMVGR